jgi:hypothetical protein
MKVWIDSDERYPDYFVKERPASHLTECEVDEATLARWREVIAAYESVQDEMEDAFNKANRPT